MSDDKAQIAPEILALVHEVIADPRSTILHPPKIKCAKLLGLTETAISPGANYLTTAEQHLLLMHREEVAKMLYEAASNRLTKGGVIESRVELKSAITMDAEWIERVGRVMERGGSTDLSTELEMLRNAGRPQSFSLGASTLAATSLRILPNDKTRILLALALDSEGRTDEAVSALHAVLNNQPLNKNRSLCHLNLGFFAANLMDFDHALASAREASACPDSLADADCNWLVLALRDGSRTEIRSAARRVAERDADSLPILDQVAMLLRADVEEGYWHPTRESQRSVERIADELPEVVRCVVDVIL